MNIAILSSVRNTLENVAVAGKENMLRMIACMNALEQLIQEASQPAEPPQPSPEQPAGPPQGEETTEGVDS